MKLFFESLGFDITFIAGTAGAIASLTKQKGITFNQQIVIVLSGGFTANFLTPLTAEWLGFSEKTLYGIAFLLGYLGMKSVEILIKKLFKPNENETKQDKI